MFEDAAVSGLTDSSSPSRFARRLTCREATPGQTAGRRASRVVLGGRGGLYVNQPKSSKQEEASVRGTAVVTVVSDPLGPPVTPAAPFLKRARSFR